MSNAQRYRNRMAEAHEREQMRDEYHAMEERVAELEDKCDRLREALGKIRDWHFEGRNAKAGMRDIARKALQEAGDE